MVGGLSISPSDHWVPYRDVHKSIHSDAGGDRRHSKDTTIKSWTGTFQERYFFTGCPESIWGYLVSHSHHHVLFYNIPISEPEGVP